MSHTTKLNTIPITDIHALEAAIKELAAQGVDISLKRNAEPRMYYPEQITKQVASQKNHGLQLHENPEECDYVVSLPMCPYDIGLIKKQGSNEYELLYDKWAGHIRKQVGHKDVKSDVGNVSRLVQGYAKHAAIRTATMQGHKVQSATVDSDGKVQIHVAL